jgi:hypothetical protein
MGAIYRGPDAGRGHRARVSDVMHQLSVSSYQFKELLPVELETTGVYQRARYRRSIFRLKPEATNPKTISRGFRLQAEVWWAGRY